MVSPFVDKRHGTERAIAELVERLAGDYGCEIHLYAQRVEGLALAARKTSCPGVSGSIVWHRVPTIPGPHVLQFLAWLLLNSALRRRDASRRRAPYDLVLSPGINCFHPDVVIVHALFHRLRELAAEGGGNSGARGSIFRRWHRRLYYGLLTYLERRTYTNARVRLAAVSKRTAVLLKTYFGRDDVSVIPNGVDRNHFSPEARLSRRSAARERRAFQDGDCVLLLIGNDWRVKGLPVILRAMAALGELPLRLLVVGNEATEFFRTETAQLGLADRCVFESPTSDVLELYAAADVYVSPSREDSFGLPVAEAMSCGLPVITSASAGIADYVRDGIDGFVLSDPTDSARLATLIRDVHQWKGHVPSGQPEAAHSDLWTWEENAHAIFELLRAVGTK